ncbi:MAG: short-chain dehydrogenase/reductase [Actinomycetia bacterium]|nr:short-chain dehydrogenase/reductase [Actinomycetes bacterium]
MTDDWFFAGKRAIVTGGASGIGRAVVTQLVRMGTKVWSLDVSGQDDGPSPLMVPVALDLMDGAATQAWLDGVAAEEPIDFVVNAAGVSPLRETLERVVGIDFLALHRICSWAAPRLEAGGAIVNVASVAGIYDAHTEIAEVLIEAADLALADDASGAAGSAGFFTTANARIDGPGIAYAYAKRAVILLTMRIAAQQAGRQVRANSTSPHAAATPMHYAIKRNEPEMYERAKMTSTFGGRWSSPDEQADVVLFLLGPRSTYVSGVNLLVDGGWYAAMQTTSPELTQH